MSSSRGLPDFRKMRHDRHYVDELATRSMVTIGMMIPLAAIETNAQQPRSDLGDLAELTKSIRARGVLEPLLVRPIGPSRYQLIAGERRFHAATAAGLSEVPCIEIAASDQEALELALVENLQRKDLSPFEEAEGFATLVESHGYTHEHVAAAVGKSRSSVTESLRLLAIPPGIRDLCRHADITAKTVLLVIARASSISEMERLVTEIAEQNVDRETLRALANTPRHGPAPSDVDPEASNRNEQVGRFRPIQIRFKPEAGRAIQFAVSIRQPNVTRDDLIRTLETILHDVRQGKLDERLSTGTPASS